MANYRTNRWVDDSYEHLLERITESGNPRLDRTGVGTRSAFGQSLTFNLRNGFPLVTTKNVHFKSVVGELLWFLSGSTDKNELREKYGVTIWDEWNAPNPQFDGDLGPIYSEQWRGARWLNAAGDPVFIDQISRVIDSLKNDPFGRRHIVNAWNVGQLDDMALPPCHMMFQFWVEADDRGNPVSLSLQMYQRSADMFLGVPFNIASYALMLEMVAAQVGLHPEMVRIVFGDAHVYSNHIEAVETQLQRQPKLFPTISLDRAESIFDYTPEMIHLHGYAPHPRISAPVAV